MIAVLAVRAVTRTWSDIGARASAMPARATA